MSDFTERKTYEDNSATGGPQPYGQSVYGRTVYGTGVKVDANGDPLSDFEERDIDE